MKISIVCCLFVLDNQKNDNKKKNDIKTLKVVVSKKENELIHCSFDEKNGIKEAIRLKIKDVIGSDKFHLEQVYTLGDKKYYDDKSIDIIYMGLANAQNISSLDENYELVDFNVENNEKITFGDSRYFYKTEKKNISGSLEYYHRIDVDDVVIEKKLVELMTAFKHLRFRMDKTDVCFKLLPDVFTLEDVRIVFELVKDVEVDKSNFRKKIIKYCKKIDKVVGDKGYRPSQMYEFDPSSIEDWL